MSADIKIPGTFKFIIKYVTPVMLILVFIGTVFTPEGNNWAAAFSSLFAGNGWKFDNGSLIMILTTANVYQNLARGRRSKDQDNTQ